MNFLQPAVSARKPLASGVTGCEAWGLTHTVVVEFDIRLQQ